MTQDSLDSQMLCVGLMFATYGVDYTMTKDRLGTTVGILVTVVSVRLNISRHMPKISYITNLVSS